MKPFIIFAALLVACTASPVLYSVPTIRAYPFSYSAQGNSLITPTQQQYQAQDQLGQYAYGYSEPLSSKQEVRSLDGITRGSYSYRDPAGQLQTVDYTADAAGFHVAATNLPRAVKPQSNFRAPEASTANIAYAPAAYTDSGPVAAAGQSYLAPHEAAKLRLAASPTADNQSAAAAANVRLLELPAPVADAPVVAAAKSIHLKRVAAEKFHNEAFTAPVIFPRIYSYGLPSVYSPTLFY